MSTLYGVGFTYAHGPCRESTRKPGSAFSRGDLLMLDSNSSLSRINPLMPSGTLIVGVAKADSDESINSEVPYIVPQHDTVWWASCATNSNFTGGEHLDIEFATGYRYRVATSTGTQVVRIDPAGDSAYVVESATSRVRVRIDSTYLLDT